MRDLLERIREKRVIGEPGGPSGTFYSVVTESGRVVALQIPNKADAIEIRQLPELIQLRYEWSSIINRLACIVLDGATSNDEDYAQDMINMVVKYL